MANPELPIPSDGETAEMPSPEDAQFLVRSVIERAEADAALLAAFCKNLGLKPKKPADRPCEIDPAIVPGLRKLTAAIRLSLWESSGLDKHIKRPLPKSDDVLADLCRNRNPEQERFPAGQVGRDVFGAWLWEMAWRPLDGSAADVVINAVDGNAVLDPVAELIWQFRHLVQPAE